MKKYFKNYNSLDYVIIYLYTFFTPTVNKRYKCYFAVCP